MRRSLVMSGDAPRKIKTRPANQPHAIRAKIRFWRAAMRREAGEGENFFIAKNRDSESAQRALRQSRRDAMMWRRRRSLNAQLAKTPAAQALLAILTSAIIGFSRAVRIVARTVRRVVDQRASRALKSLRQHFLKQDAVFLHVLVYSG